VNQNFSAGALWIGAELIDKNGNVVLVKQLYRDELNDNLSCEPKLYLSQQNMYDNLQLESYRP